MENSTHYPTLSIKSNFFWTWFGNAIYLSTQWVLLVIIAKMGNSTLVGDFSLGLAVSAPIFIFFQMQLRQTLVTDIKGEYAFPDYWYARVILTIISFFTVFVFSIFSGFSGKMLLIILFISLSKSFENLSDLIHGKFQKFHRMDFIAISMISRGLLTMLIFGVVFYFTRDLTNSVMGMAIVWAAICILFDMRYSRFFREESEKDHSWNFSKFRNLVWFALPLSVSSGLTSLCGNIPRYFLEYFSGRDAVGHFSVAVAPLTFTTMLQGAIAQAVMAKAACHFQNREINDFLRLSRKTTLAFFVTAVGMTSIFWIFGKEIISILFSKEYQFLLPALLVMSLGNVLNCFAVLGSLVLVGGRMFKLQLAGIVFSVSVLIVACFFLVEKFGVLGAAWADFIKTFWTLLFYMVVGHYFVKRKPDLKQ